MVPGVWEGNDWTRNGDERNQKVELRVGRIRNLRNSSLIISWIQLVHKKVINLILFFLTTIKTGAAIQEVCLQEKILH